MNKRPDVIRELHDGPRLLLQNVLDARPDKEIPKAIGSTWNPNEPMKKLRIRLSKRKARFNGIDIHLSPLP